MGPRSALESHQVSRHAKFFRLLWLGLAASVPGTASAHGSEYVYARLVLGSHPQLEVCLEYTENPVVQSRTDALATLARDLLVHVNGLDSSLADLTPQPVWGETGAFPQSAPVPVPQPGDGSNHRLVTASIDLTHVRGELQLALKPGSEQAVIYWIEEPGSDPSQMRWQVLLAGDQSPGVDLGPVLISK